MHMAHALFKRVSTARHVTGDEGTSHHVRGVVKSWRGEISWVRTTGADTGPLCGWRERNVWKERGMLV